MKSNKDPEAWVGFVGVALFLFVVSLFNGRPSYNPF
jgi:hypothetical protein